MNLELEQQIVVTIAYIQEAGCTGRNPEHDVQGVLMSRDSCRDAQQRTALIINPAASGQDINWSGFSREHLLRPCDCSRLKPLQIPLQAAGN